MQNPLVIFAGAAVATLAALLGVTYDKWSTDAIPTAQIAASAPATVTPEATAPASSGSSSTTAGAMAPAATDAPAEGSAPQQDVASVEPQQPATSADVAANPAPTPDDRAPTFDTIRVETDGSAVMAGRGMPSTDVTVMLDGEPLGTTRTDNGGAWVFVPEEPLPPGDHALTLRMKMASTDSVPSSQSVAVKVPERGSDEALVVLNDMNQASKVLQKPPSTEAAAASSEESTKVASAGEAPASSTSGAAGLAAPTRTALTLNTVDYNDAGDIIFSGNAAAGSSVRLYVDNHSVGDATVDATGAWTFAGRNQIKPGNHTLRVDQLDTSAKVAQRIELPFVRAEPQEVAALTGQQQSQPAPAAEAAQPAASAEQAATPSAPAAAATTPDVAAVEETPPEAEPSAEEEVASAEAEQSESSGTTSADAKVAAAAPAPAAADEPAATTSNGTSSAAPTEPDSTTLGETSTAPAPETTNEATAAAPVGETAAADQSEASASRIGRVVIQPGNNLWRISRVIYGQGVQYTVIYQANKEQIRNPNLIYPGQIFATPGVTPPEKIDPEQRVPLENSASGTTSG